MSEQPILEAFASTPPPPCEVFACQWVKKCSQERLACSAFASYVATGFAIKPAGIPSRGRYLEVFGAAQPAKLPTKTCNLSKGVRS